MDLTYTPVAEKEKSFSDMKRGEHFMMDSLVYMKTNWLTKGGDIIAVCLHDGDVKLIDEDSSEFYRMITVRGSYSFVPDRCLQIGEEKK